MIVRFRYLAADGHEVGLGTTGELVRAFLSGELEENTLLFDAQGGGWAPAKDHSVFLTLAIPGTPFTLAESAPMAPEEALAEVLRGRGEDSPNVVPAMHGLTVPGASLSHTQGLSSARSAHGAPRAAMPAADLRAHTEAAWEGTSARVRSPEPDLERGPTPRPAPGLLGAATAGLAGLATALILVVLVWDSVGGSARAQEPPVSLAMTASSSVASGFSKGMSTAELQAFRDMSGEMERLRAQQQLTRVPAAWLEGLYLSGASRYPEVREYWQKYVGYVQEMQQREADLYRHSFVKRLERQGVSTSAVSMLLARALRTFESDRARREAVYASMLQLGNTAVELHDLLLAHEGEIVFEPASSGVSRDPVIEAVAQNDELQAKMNGLLDKMFVAIEQAEGERVVPRKELPLLLERSLIPSESAIR